MPRPSYAEAASHGGAIAPLVSGKNPDGTDYALPVVFAYDKSSQAQTFEEWAVRNGYMAEHFSGEVPVPAAAETTLWDQTVPTGHTWYRRRAWYSTEGTRTGRFKLYRTLPGQAETYTNLVVVRNNESLALETYGKYPGGSRVRAAVKPDATAAAGDIVSARVQFIKLPWAE